MDTRKDVFTCYESEDMVDMLSIKDVAAYTDEVAVDVGGGGGV